MKNPTSRSATSTNRREFLRKLSVGGCLMASGTALADKIYDDSLDANGFPEGYLEYTKRLATLNERAGAHPRDPSIMLECPFAARSYRNGRLDMDVNTVGPYPDLYPKGALVHVTEGHFGSNENMEDTIADGKRAHYAYFGIARSGKIYQTHSLDRSGYHAGTSFHKKLGSSVSAVLLGIEIAAAGTLRKAATGNYYKCWNEGAKKEKPSITQIHSTEVRPGIVNISEEQDPPPPNNVNNSGFYHIMSPEQEWALTHLLIWLRDNNPKVFKTDYVIGHDEVAPKRKTDPGGALSVSLEEYRAFLQRDSSKGYVKRFKAKYVDKVGFGSDEKPLSIKEYLNK